MLAAHKDSLKDQGNISIEHIDTRIACVPDLLLQNVDDCCFAQYTILVIPRFSICIRIRWSHLSRRYLVDSPTRSTILSSQFHQIANNSYRTLSLSLSRHISYPFQRLTLVEIPDWIPESRPAKHCWCHKWVCSWEATSCGGTAGTPGVFSDFTLEPPLLYCPRI